MMDQTASQDQLFYAFNLEDHMPRGHLLRGVNRFFDLNFTAMMAPEIKNPLTASQLALADIAKRPDSNDPVSRRAEKTKTSLQEIDAIADRCTELASY